MPKLAFQIFRSCTQAAHKELEEEILQVRTGSLCTAPHSTTTASAAHDPLMIACGSRAFAFAQQRRQQRKQKQQLTTFEMSLHILTCTLRRRQNIPKRTPTKYDFFIIFLYDILLYFSASSLRMNRCSIITAQTTIINL